MICEDVGTTPRKPLTPRQRLKLYEDHKGICAICDLKIHSGEKWIDEHLRALGLAGPNDLDNRAPVHVRCAEVKTQTEDMPRIVKAKAQKRAALGIKTDGPKIKSAGFAKSDKTSAIDKSALPKLKPRNLYA